MCNHKKQIEFCDACCSTNVILTTNEELHGSKKHDNRFIYYCPDCKASVSCHAGTATPLGKMADRHTRQLRQKAHIEFDKMWESGVMTRNKAYDWLASYLQIAPSQCHIAWLTKEQLKTVIVICSEYFDENLKALSKRKAKKDDKRRKQSERTIYDDYKRPREYTKRRKARR